MRVQSDDVRVEVAAVSAAYRSVASVFGKGNKFQVSNYYVIHLPPLSLTRSIYGELNQNINPRLCSFSVGRHEFEVAI